MANDLKFTLSGDPRSLLDALQRTRAAALKTYGDMRTGVDAAKTAWAEAQGKVQALATALAGVEAPTKKQAAKRQAKSTCLVYLSLRNILLITSKSLEPRTILSS